MQRLSAKDRGILGLLFFFLAVALFLELPWLHYGADLSGRASDTLVAKIFAIYAPCDRAYYDAITPFTVCLEGINVFFSQVLNLALAWAILKRRPWRHPMQLAIGSYLAYSVVLYFLHGIVSGYADMRERSTYTYFLFYATNMPWLLGYLWLALDSAVAITRRFRAPE